MAQTHSNQPKIKFSDFLNRFPEVNLPITLSDDLHYTFSEQNLPLSALMIEQHIAPIEPIDEFTEFIACFKIPKTHDFHAIVFWKAGLLNYYYILATFDKTGRFIDKRVIAGTASDGKVVTKSVATIEEDWLIHVVSGQLLSNSETYDAATSMAFELEMLADGHIIIAT